jgi:hypothetical protein
LIIIDVKLAKVLNIMKIIANNAIIKIEKKK